jgi:hypothetical protein
MPAASVNWKEVSEITEHVATVTGIAAAGIWAIFNFKKSRTYFPRMQMTASGKLRTFGNCQYIVPRITLKNLGKAKIPLLQSGSGYRIWVATEPNEQFRPTIWTGGKPVYRMFEEHEWLEPDESIFDEKHMIPLPSNCIAVKIQARLVAQVKWFPRRKIRNGTPRPLSGRVPY